jgi:hypothetical protein
MNVFECIANSRLQQISICMHEIEYFTAQGAVGLAALGWWRGELHRLLYNS